MYEEFFGLKERPFTILSDPDYLFLTSVHKQALVHLEYGLLHRTSFIVITGEIGIGKTTLIRKIIGNISAETHFASICCTTGNAEDFLELVLHEFELPFKNRSKIDKLSILNKFLIEKYAAKTSVILIVDEAQNLSYEVLEEIRLISNLQTNKDFLLQTILVGQPDLKDKLNNPLLEQFAQRISVYYHMSPISLKETKEYIEHRLRVSGYSNGNPLFSDKAVDLIYEYSRGIPRIINIICDWTMVYAYGEEVRTIDKEITNQVISDNQGCIPSKKTYVSEKPQESSPDGEENINVDNKLNTRLKYLEKKVNELESALMTTSKVVNTFLTTSKIPLYKNLLTKEDAINILKSVNFKVDISDIMQKMIKLHQKIDIAIEEIKGEKKTGKSQG